MDWTWHPHPDAWLIAAVLGGGYAFALLRLAPARLPAGMPAATRRQVASFGAGVLTILIAADWPLHDLAEGYLYSAHMVQHMLLSLVAPPLLLLGTPAWLARALLPPPLLRLVRAISRPLPALALFNAVIVIVHWPALVDVTLRNEIAHLAVHALLLTASFVMWMPVVSPLLEVPRLSYPGQMVFLFLQSIVPTVPASFLTFGSAPLYRFYETVPRLWGFSALDDQRLGGLLMKIAGGLVLWGWITALFFRWYAIEQSDGSDALQWRDVDRHLNRAKPVSR